MYQQFKLTPQSHFKVCPVVGTGDVFDKGTLPCRHMEGGRSALLLSDPVSCSNFCCFCFGIWLLLRSGPPHPDILTSLHFLFLFLSLYPCFPSSSLLFLLPPPLSFLLCVCVWSQRHCTLPTYLCKNGPSVCSCVFPAQWVGFLWLLYFIHIMM